MSDVNLDFTVSNNSIEFTVQPNDITITPTDVQLNIYAAGLGVPGGSTGQLQYNNGGILGGVANTSFNGTNLTLGNVNNIKITGGSPNYGLITDGSGNLSWGQVANSNYANVANVANSLNAISIANVIIGGGVNGYVLQTDGAGNLDWTAMTGGGGGNGTPGGANTQIQYNDSGLFGGNAGFTFNEITGNVNIPGNLIIGGTFAGNATNANYANYSGNAFSVNGSNVSGQVSNALVAGTVYTNAQPNITSLGTLSDLDVANYANANIVKGNTVLATSSANIANVNFSAGVITTNGLLGNITGANVVNCQTLTAVNLNIPQGYNPNATTAGNVTIQYKLPIVINGNTYYIGLTSSI